MFIDIKMYRCSMCGVNRPSFKKLLTHYRDLHIHDPNFKITCNVGICSKPYNVYKSFTSHVKRKHSLEYLEIEDGILPDSLVIENQHNEPHINEQTNNVNENEIQNHEDSLVNLRKNMALMILKLRENHLLPRSVAMSISNDVSVIVENVKELCTNSEPGEIPEVETLTDVIRSDYKLNSFCKQQLELLSPIEYNLGENYRNGKTFKDTFQYVNILKLLERMLYFDDVWEEIQKYALEGKREGEHSTVSDYDQGQIFMNHEIFKNDKSLLRIHLYTDELELVNPLGSKRGKHKISLFYFFREFATWI